MVQVGTFCPSIPASQNLCQVVSIYNPRDIEPEFPETVGIIGKVKFVLLSGDDIGRTFKQKRADFNYRWEIIDDEEGVSQ